MYNKVILVGNLTKDIEIRYSQSGSAIARAGIATTRKWKSQSGEAKEEVMFIDITFFGRTAEIANQYLSKGSKVLIDGRLDFQQWTSNDGTKRSKHSIIVESMQMLSTRSQHDAQPKPQYKPQPQSQSQYQPRIQPQQPHPQATYNDDDIPF